MVEFGRSDCLSHPLCEQLLERKWNRYGLPLYALSTLFYLFFLFTLTLIVITHPSCIHRGGVDHETYTLNMTLCHEDIIRDATYYQMFKENYIYFMLSAICIFFSILIIIKEIIQFTIEVTPPPMKAKIEGIALLQSIKQSIYLSFVFYVDYLESGIL